MLLARGGLKDIVIPCRHTVLSLSNLLQYYTRLQSRHLVVVILVAVAVARTTVPRGGELECRPTGIDV